MKKEHILGQHTGNVLPSHVISYDTETVRNVVGDKEEFHTLRLGHARYMKLDKELNITKEETLDFTTANEFFTWIETFGRQSGHESIYLFAHNAGYDFQVLGGILELPKRGHTFTKEIIADTAFIWETELKGKRYIWLDTMNYARTSLAKLGKTVGLAKTSPGGKEDADYSAEEWNALPEADMLSYCRNDVKITERFVLLWLKFLRENNFGSFMPTIAAQAMKSYRHGYMPTEIFIHNNEEAIKLERDAYHGGRCECFYLGQLQFRLRYLDFASLYPSIMKSMPLPTKLIKVLVEPTEKEMKIFEEKLWIMDAEVEIKEPCIPVKAERLIFPVGKWRCQISTPEIQLLKETGGKICHVYQLNVYDSYTGLFASWVEKLYGLRQKYIAEGNDVFQYCAKIMMNALSGKWGQKNNEWEIVGEPIPLTELGVYKEMVIQDDDSELVMTVKKMLGRVWVKGDWKEGFDSFVAIITFITAYGRAKLFRVMQRAGKGHYYYGDTDSLIVDDKGYRRLWRDITKNKELGMLEMERELTGAEIRGAKDYTLFEVGKKPEIKIKGIRGNAVELEDGVYEQDKWHRLNGLIRAGIGRGVKIERIKKHMHRNYQKGVVKEDGYVRPLNDDGF